jgi:2'-5' RNA ligase
MTFPWSDGSDISMVPADWEGTYTEYEVSLSGGEQELSDEDVDLLLQGDYTPLGLTATAQAVIADSSDHTGAMIALLPTQSDMDRLYVIGGEEDDELHLTLCYLGDAAKIPPGMRDNIIESMRHTAQQTSIVDADLFGIATFNETNGEKDTCVVGLVTGDELSRAQQSLGNVAHDWMQDALPEQHKPWVPHITFIYTNDGSIAQTLSNREGPVRFDRVRVVFGGEVTDFPLYDGTAESETVEENPVEEYEDGVQAAGDKESDVNKKGGNHNLKAYWTHGPGAAKIGWGTDGSFARCVTQLGKYVKNPQGLCAEYHHAATGEWPTEGGKHGIPSEVDIVVLESEVVVADAAVDIEAELGEYDGGWEGTIVAEDSDTGDGRMFAGGSLTWGDTTEQIHPFQWAPANMGEHKGSVTAGRIDRMWRSPENPRIIRGKGRFNLNDPDGLRAFRQVRDGFAGGVSIDPDQIADADVELEFASDVMAGDPFAKPTKTIFHAGRIRGATLVAFPALVEAAIKLTKKTDAPALIAASTASWRPSQYELRLSETNEIDGLVASVAFAYVRELDDVVDRKQCRFLHHEINEDGSVGLASLTACAQHIAAINAGRTFGLAHQELFDAYQHMAQHFTDAGQDAPAFALETTDAVVASIPTSPPLEWFGNPNLTGPTPITVTEDGRVFGHAAAWNSCHTGFADTCVSPPFENDYGYFTTGEVLTAEGHRVAVGQITLGTSHAATRGLSVAKAIDHYGDTGTAVADVTAGADDHGIWIAGAVRPSCSMDHVQALRASALSGDWRRIGGALRMVALLAVNVPGFPIPRVGTALSSGKQMSLVASGVVEHNDDVALSAELTLLAGSCGIPLGKKDEKMKYESMADEIAALAIEIKE